MPTKYNTKSLQDHINGSAPEDGGLGRAGLYRHPESGQEMHTLSDPLFGEAQSNAAVRLGFVRVRDSKPSEIHNIAMDSINAAQGDTDTLKGVTARLNVLEGTQAKNVELERQLEEMRAKYESGSPTDSSSVAVAAEAAKNAAKDQIADRGQGDTSEVEVPKAADAPSAAPVNQGSDELPADSASELHPDSPRLDDEDEDSEEDEEETVKPLGQQNETELKQTAAREGVDLSKAETVKAKRAAIQAHRDLAEESEQE